MRESGQALVETIAAIAVASIVAVALVGLVVSSLRSSSSAKNEAEALRLVAEELEFIRNFRDENGFSELVDQTDSCRDSSNVCFVASSSVISTGKETGVGGIFNRYFYTNYSSGGEMEVVATVDWQEGGNIRKIESASKYSEWYKKTN